MVIPYFGYARQDRKDKPRVPITAKLVANLITTAGADRVLAMDLHSQQLQGFFDIPVDHLYARPVLAPVLKEIIGEDPVVVAPDSGSAKMAMYYGDLLGGGLPWSPSGASTRPPLLPRTSWAMSATKSA